MSLLTVENLSYAHADKRIFHDISFRLVKGEHAGLVGPNGAGKTTLFRLLTNQLLPDAGRISWFPGIKVGYLEQQLHFPPGQTLREYLYGSFSHLFVIEREIQELYEKMAGVEAEELTRLLERLEVLQEQLEHGDLHLIQAKTEEIAAGLGLTELGLERDVEQLSGGQRTKLRLARLLLEQPQILLLDEPTNYLDEEHIIWLTSYLKSYPHAFLLISHEISFLDDVVDIIYHLDNLKINRYVGNYNKFLAQLDAQQSAMIQAYNRQQQEITKMKTFIAKNKARASTSTRAKSREKMLAKIDIIEKPASLPKPNFSFQLSPPSGQIILTAEGLEIGYESPLLPPLDLQLKRGEKIALIGHNGIGKSTTLKTMLGLIPPLAGSLIHGEKVVPAYFAQEEKMTADHMALEEVWRVFPSFTQQEIRQALARCGLTQKHIHQSVRTLSGGEQTKIQLCKLMLTPSNWLVLDEPTNHLDVTAKEALRETLMAYKGTILLVSHEPEFYEEWVTGVWNAEEWRSK